MTIDPDHIPYQAATRPSGGVPPQPSRPTPPVPPSPPGPPAACFGSPEPVLGWLPQINVTNLSQSYRGSTGLHVARRRQSAAVHVFLFMTTAGLGNLWYAWHVTHWNRIRGL